MTEQPCGAPCVIITDGPIKIQKEATKSTLEQKWKHHRLKKNNVEEGGGEGGGAVAGSGWGDVEVCGCLGGRLGRWVWLTKRGWQWGVSWHHQSHFPRLIHHNKDDRDKRKTHQGHPALPLFSVEVGGAEEAIITTLHNAFQNKNV